MKPSAPLTQIIYLSHVWGIVCFSVSFFDFILVPVSAAEGQFMN